jgi:hypothetical protein
MKYNTKMSEEQTPIEEKIFNAFEKTFGVKTDDIYKAMNLRSDEYLDLIENILFIEITKEKEQREELIKAVSVEFADRCIYKRVQREEIRSEFEQYYNEVIKPKYKL